MLMIDEARKALERVRDRVERKLGNGHPYVTVSIKRIKKRASVNTTQRKHLIEFLITKLRENYAVTADRSWLIIEAQ